MNIHFIKCTTEEDVSNTRLCISFQHDGTPPHFSREVRQWLSQNYPGTLDTSRTWSPVPGLHAYLTWILSTFVLWECLKTEVCATTVVNREELWRLIQHLASEIKKTAEPSRACELLFHRQLICVSMNTETISSTSCWKGKMKWLLIVILFVFLLYTTRKPHLRREHKVKIRRAATFQRKPSGYITIRTFSPILMSGNHPVMYDM
jgi:hypothetical protein